MDKVVAKFKIERASNGDCHVMELGKDHTISRDCKCAPRFFNHYKDEVGEYADPPLVVQHDDGPQ